MIVRIDALRLASFTVFPLEANNSPVFRFRSRTWRRSTTQRKLSMQTAPDRLCSSLPGLAAAGFHRR